MAKPTKHTDAKEEEAPKGKNPYMQEDDEVLVRVLTYDIPGSRKIYAGLTRIKGISWAISNAICVHLKIPRDKKISELTKDDIQKIEDFASKLPIADFLKNRQKDLETGETKHLTGTKLDMKKDFDIRRLKKIRSYKGARHAAGLPVRGQRTRSNFRKKGSKAVGVKRKK